MKKIEPLSFDAETGLPIVEARRFRNTKTWIVWCPYCGKKHGHGAITDSPAHRVADCGKGPGYFVVAGPRALEA